MLFLTFVMDRAYIDFQRLFVFTLCSVFFGRTHQRTKENLAARSHYSGRCHATSEWAGRRPTSETLRAQSKAYLPDNERRPSACGRSILGGASAFLLKQSAASELTDAVERVLKGSSYVTPRAAKGQANIFLRGPQASERTAEPTLRQREVIQLMVEGHSMKEAADILKITMRTVACHKYAAMELLQLKTNAELVRYAIKHNAEHF